MPDTPEFACKVNVVLAELLAAGRLDEATATEIRAAALADMQEATELLDQQAAHIRKLSAFASEQHITLELMHAAADGRRKAGQ